MFGNDQEDTSTETSMPMCEDRIPPINGLRIDYSNPDGHDQFNSIGLVQTILISSESEVVVEVRDFDQDLDSFRLIINVGGFQIFLVNLRVINQIT